MASLATDQVIAFINASSPQEGRTWTIGPLLYDAAVEGTLNPATFHQKCDNKGSTVAVAMTNTGYIMGAFTPHVWRSKGYAWLNADGSCLFRLVKRGTFDPILCRATPGYSLHVFDDPCYGPTYGGGAAYFDLLFFDGVYPLGTPSNAFCIANGNNGYEAPPDGPCTLIGNDWIIVAFQVYSVETMDPEQVEAVFAQGLN